jgi:hypothetical protein
MDFLLTPPDTSRFMQAGYAVAVIVMVLYVASLFLRERRLQRDLQDLQDLAEKQ